MFRLSAILISAVLATSCTAVRSAKSKTAEDVDNLNVCIQRSALAKNIGGVDETIAIPGGGIVEIHDVMLRNPNRNYNPATSAALSILSLGIIDLTAGVGDAVYDCKNTSNVSGFNSKCDFKRLKYYFHYAEPNAEQAACFEKQEVWSGASFYSSGDSSKCPIEYKDALAKVIDTAGMPNATLSWVDSSVPNSERQAIINQLKTMPVHQLLQAMAADNRQECPT